MSKLTPLQIELIKTFSHPVNEKQVLEIRQLLADYFARELDNAVDQLFEEKGWEASIVEQWLGSHLRTPYNSEP